MHIRSSSGKDLHPRRVRCQNHEADGKEDGKPPNIEQRLGHVARRSQDADSQRRQQTGRDGGYGRGESQHAPFGIGVIAALVLILIDYRPLISRSDQST